MSEPSPARPLSFLGAAGWTLLMALLVGIALGFVEGAHPGARFDLVTLAACKLLAYAIVLFLILRVHDPEGSIRALVGLRRPRAIHVALALVVGAGLLPGAALLDHLLAARFPVSEEDAEIAARLLAAETPARRATVALIVGLVLPVSDELFFRGALFSLLSRAGRPLASAAFAVAAYDTLVSGTSRGVLSIAAAILAFSWIRVWTGGVVPSLAARVAFFGLSVLPLALGVEEPVPTIPLAAGAAAAALLAMFALAALRTRDAATVDASASASEP